MEVDINDICLQKGVMLKGRYEVKSAISVSDLSIVYKGYDYVRGIKCVIKEYYPKGKVLRDMDGKTVVFKMPSFRHKYDEELNIFLNEGSVLRKLKHKNILKCIDYFAENDTGYIITEFCEGKTLDQYIKEERDFLISGQFKKICIPFVKTVNYIHKKGIIHRDIKPKNIIVNKNLGPVIIDFGSACINKKGVKKRISYTPGYSPLEFYSDKSNQGKYSDVYSVAATLYFYLCGKPPEKVTDRVIEDKIEDIGKYNKDISKLFSKTIMKNLSVDYKKRFSSLRLFILIMYMEYIHLRRNDRKAVAPNVDTE